MAKRIDALAALVKSLADQLGERGKGALAQLDQITAGGGKKIDLICANVARKSCTYVVKVSEKHLEFRKSRGFACPHGEWFCPDCVKAAYKTYLVGRKEVKAKKLAEKAAKAGKGKK